METKLCKACGFYKPLSEFSIFRARGRNYYRKRCKACHKLNRSKWNDERTELRRANATGRGDAYCPFKDRVDIRGLDKFLRQPTGGHAEFLQSDPVGITG